VNEEALAHWGGCRVKNRQRNKKQTAVFSNFSLVCYLNKQTVLAGVKRQGVFWEYFEGKIWVL